MDFDRNKVQRIISNLLSNAIKYNHDNGSVIVAIDKILAGDGEQIHIQISDTGIGIKNENKDKIFDRFFQEQYLQPIITQYFIDNKSEIWLLFLIAHSKR